MVKISQEAIPSIYSGFMEEIKVRIEAAKLALQNAADQMETNPAAYLHVEFCYLQIRFVTELIALAVLVAHNNIDDFRTNRFIGEYKADAIFGRLTQLNKDGFPQPFTPGAVNTEGLMDAVVSTKGHLTSVGLAKIYHDCGDRLHTRSLKRLVQLGRRYDLGEAQSWYRQIMRLLEFHVIFLPEMKRSLIVFMAYTPDGHVHCELRDLARVEGTYQTQDPGPRS